jgi:hypothetical protein
MLGLMRLKGLSVGLSALLAWITHSYAVGTLASFMVVGFALGNSLLGAYIAWRLVHS